LQFPKPVLQAVTVQAIAVHAANAFGSVQVRAQAPQLATSLWRFTSQPSAAFPLQFA